MIISGKEKIKNNDDVFMNYEVFDYLSEIIETNRKREKRHNDDTIKEKNIHKSWHGVNSYEEAENLAIKGWKEIENTKQINDIFNLKIDEEDKLVTFKNDVVGYAPIIPLVLQGIPNCMTNVQKKRVKSRIIHLVYNISVTCDRDSEDIMNAGFELTKVIMLLERQGYRVRLTAMQDFSNYEGSDMFFLNLKSEYKPLNVTSMMFPLVHTAMFRVIGFAWYERSPVTSYKSGYGHDYERDFTRHSLIKGLKNILKTNNNLVYLGFRDIEHLKAEEIIKKIKDIINKK